MIDDIVERSLHPPAEEFDVFYGRSRDRLYRALALTLGDADIATDAANEAMTRALERWDKVGGYENPSGWVYRVGVNWGRSLQRQSNRKPRKALGSASYEMSVPEPALAAAVAKLPARYRTVVVARYYMQWTPAEIADALHVPGATVRSRLRRSLDRLRRDMGVMS